MSIEDKLDTLNGYIENFADDVADSADVLNRLSQEIESKTLMEPVCFTAKLPNLQLVFYVNNSLVDNNLNRFYLEYSVDKVNWTPIWITENYQNQTPMYTFTNVGDKLYVRGQNSRLAGRSTPIVAGIQIGFRINRIGSSNIHPFANISGNILSLLYGKDFAYENTVPSCGFYRTFIYSFLPCNVDFDGAYIDVDTIDTYGLQNAFAATRVGILPIVKAKHINTDGCKSMFSSNPLVTKYDLQITNDLQNCTSMFNSCGSLTDLTVHFTEFPYGGITNWMTGVAPTGTFRCPQGLVIPERSENYVPAGWTIERI